MSDRDPKTALVPGATTAIGSTDEDLVKFGKRIVDLQRVADPASGATESERKSAVTELVRMCREIGLDVAEEGADWNAIPEPPPALLPPQPPPPGVWAYSTPIPGLGGAVYYSHPRPIRETEWRGTAKIVDKRVVGQAPVPYREDAPAARCQFCDFPVETGDLVFQRVVMGAPQVMHARCHDAWRRDDY